MALQRAASSVRAAPLRNSLLLLERLLTGAFTCIYLYSADQVTYYCLIAMVKFAQIIMGPAGTGKVRYNTQVFPSKIRNWVPRCLQSTYCKLIQEHCRNSGRSVHVGNLDPAAEEFGYEVAFGERRLTLRW